MTMGTGTGTGREGADERGRRRRKSLQVRGDFIGGWRELRNAVDDEG